METDLTKIMRNIGDLVTPVAEIIDENNSTKVQHRFKRGMKLSIHSIAKVNSPDGTKNYWCINEKGMEHLKNDNTPLGTLGELGYRQLMNEKEIINYRQ